MHATAKLSTLLGASILAGAAGAQTARPFLNYTDGRWITRPSTAEIAAIYPPAAVRAGRGAWAVLRCRVVASGRLDACSVADEGKPDTGFGRAALALAPRFQLSRASGDLPSEIDLQVGLSASQAPPIAPLVAGPELGMSELVIASMPDEPSIYVPERAQRFSKSGVARLRCVIDADGAPRLCEGLDETPPGWGFGDAALKLAGVMRIAPTTRSGQSTAGRTAMLSIAFNVPHEQPPPAPTPPASH